MKRRVVLIVAQDAGLRARMARSLGAAGYAVELAGTPRRAGEVLAAGGIRVVIVVPDGFGPVADLIEEARAAVGPVVVWHGSASAFDEQELRSRFSAALAASRGATAGNVAPSPPLSFAGRTVDLDGRAFLDESGREVPLTRNEFALLSAFLQSPGRVLSREQLRSRIAGADLEAYERSIDMLVSRLRRKVEPDPKAPRLILTVPGAGYKFAAAVATVTRPSSPAAVAPDAPPVPRGGAQTDMAAQPVERRLATFLCCRIVGAAALARERDPEEAQAALGAVHQAASRLFASCRGTILRQSGDGMIACFGYPEAGEDDAERAVRAGLRLVEAVAGLPSALKLRIGIATGQAVIGAFSGDFSESPRGGARSRGADGVGAIGEAPDRAEQLAVTAPDDGVMITEGTRRLVGRIFEYRAAGALPSEGNDPVPLWRVAAEAPFAGRFAARRGRGAAAFVGRGEELALLQRRWWQAEHGAGQVVLVSGEPGIGKSRLALACAGRLSGGRGYVRLRCFGSPQHRNTELFPVIDYLERAAGFARGDSAEDKLAKLAALAARSGCDAGEAVQLLASLLFLPADDGVLGRLGPRQRREKTLMLLLAMVERLAAMQPVFLLCEDAQWFDPTSLDLLALTVERAQRLPILLLVTARPGFAPVWADHPQVTVLPLARLPHSEAAALVEGAAGDRPLPRDLAAEIVARGDGVPLFLEELTKAALEGGLPGGPARPGRPHEIPTTLEGLLLSRLDRLGPAKRVAQLGAAIGRTFPHELLAMLAEGDGPPSEGSGPQGGFDAALDRLIGSGLIYRQGVPPDTTYSFKHALVRDAAYASLSQRRRRELHARIAAALEEIFPEIAAAEPELLAHHHAEAGNPMRAADCLARTAERALSRGAVTEAIAHCRRALPMLADLPEGDPRRRLEAKVQTAVGRAFVAQKYATAPEATQAFDKARALCEALDDTVALPWIVNLQRYTSLIGGQYRRGIEQAGWLLQFGQRHDHPTWKTAGNYGIGACSMWLGEFGRAHRHLAAAVALGVFELPEGRVVTFGAGDTRISAIGYIHNCLFLLGRSEEAAITADRLLSETAALSHPYARGIALSNICRMKAIQRDANAVLPYAAELLALGNTAGYQMFTALAMIYRGWAMAFTGSDAEGPELCRRGIAACRASGTRIGLALALGFHAEAAYKTGDRDGAVQALSDAAEVGRETDERFWQAELLRLEGEIHAETNRDIERAEACFRQALATAREQEARTLQLRAAASLACLWRDHDRRQEARAVLAPSCEAYLTAGGSREDAELQEAKAIFSGLA
ncbi:MAG TPA: winged helix-turn-helix domain-containing protein [Stellaceae bacterium]|nr:winged helix-turn-helix domain-containing protein [Stellaceae bacterium]